ncbi:tetratricopeptide repeat protein [Leptolyngbya sp. NK1-12]|uniref:Tetratricopeptide repeat protein n=1 Tax=Leptolyngbya sp. NK1-12 TaxID=2547451 RepID=A0AA96WLD5_9CYAN|nr:tetratricopeptide repeat protein [Leptolyngbya sp. NK1-12]
MRISPKPLPRRQLRPPSNSLLVHLPPVIMLNQVQHYLTKINFLLANQPPQLNMNDKIPDRIHLESAPTAKTLYLPSTQAEPLNLPSSNGASVSATDHFQSASQSASQAEAAVAIKTAERLVLLPNLAASDAEHASRELLQQGNLLLQQGQLDAAITIYRNALQLDPTSVEAYQHLAQALSSQGNLEEAAVCYRRAIELTALTATANTLEANATANPAQNHSEIEAEASLDEAETEEEQPLPWFEEAAFYLQQGKAHCRIQNWDAAITACEQAIQLMGPKTAEAFYMLGQSYQGKGRLDDAKRSYSQALRLQPKQAEVYAYLASVYSEQQEFTKAIECYKQAISLNPKFAGAYWAMGELWQKLGNQEQATNCWYQALQLEPDWGTAREHWRLGTALTEQGKLREAILSFTQAISFDPNFAEAHHNLGIVLGKQGKWQEALKCHRQAVEQDSNNPQLLAGLGRALVALEAWEEASATYQRVTQLNLNGAQGYAVFQHALTQLEYCQRAIVARSYHHMAEGLCQQGKWQEAILCYRQAAERNPRSAQIQAGLGKALARLEQWDAAVAVYQQAMELAPDQTQYYLEFGDVLIQREQLQKQRQRSNSQPTSHTPVKVQEAAKIDSTTEPTFTLL